MTASRTLVETGTPGWYEDPTAPGKKTRRSNGDTVVTREQYEAMKSAAEGDDAAEAARKRTVREAAAEVTTLSSGKVAVGPTTTIKCAWREGNKRCNAERVIKVQDAFQVRYCLPHQKANRAAIRARKNAARRAELKAAKAAAGS